MKVKDNSGVFKRCKLRGSYLECKYNVDAHKKFFGVDIENC